MRTSPPKFASLEDFFVAAGELGFARIELNHHIDSAMLAGIDLSGYSFSSVHEPCPADISADQLKARDWLISSTDETCRREGVKAIQHSIHLAQELNASAVVIHAGSAMADSQPEAQLRALIKNGQRNSEGYQAIFRQMEVTRREQAAPRLAAVKRSLLELLETAVPAGIRLGLENRYHYFEFPLPDELEMLLALAGPQHLGLIYDVGHAAALDRMGFVPHLEWLERFAPRIVGTHLHDVIGTTDHYAAGLGEVDFAAVAAHLPAEAFRTCEFQHTNTPQQVRAGLQVLAEQGCIQSLPIRKK
jgi:sugar phosphate isomerase/epimerase